MDTRTSEPRITIVGGGYVGMYTALRLQKKLARRSQGHGRRPAAVHDVPALPARGRRRLHLAPPRRRAAAARSSTGAAVSPREATAVDHAARISHPRPSAGKVEPSASATTYSSSRPARSRAPCPIPGLAEHGVGFKTVGEAIGLRNHVLARMDIAASYERPAALRRAALTFVFVGGGYAGVEALAELEDMARYAARYYPNVSAGGHEVDARRGVGTGSCPRSAPRWAAYTVERLRDRNIDVRLSTTPGVLGRRARGALRWRRVRRRHRRVDGRRETEPAARRHRPAAGRPAGRLECTAGAPASTGTHNAWAAGDAAAVPDLRRTSPARYAPRTPSTPSARPRCSPTTSSPTLRGETSTRTYTHSTSDRWPASACYKGVAHVYGVKLKGFPAWLMHRAYHLGRVPTFPQGARRRRLGAGALFGREIVSLGHIEHPRLAGHPLRSPRHPSRARRGPRTRVWQG